MPLASSITKDENGNLSQGLAVWPLALLSLSGACHSCGSRNPDKGEPWTPATCFRRHKLRGSDAGEAPGSINGLFSEQFLSGVTGFGAGMIPLAFSSSTARRAHP